MQQQIHQPLSTLARAALLLAACVLPLQAQAQCREGEAPPPSRNEFKRSQMVVMGRVIETVKHPAAADPSLTESTDYTFQVDRQLKGKRVRTFIVHAPNTPASFQMNEERRYLLFVSLGKDNKWHVNSCGNSARMARPVKAPAKQ